ncbi:unnamed protein product, partial [Prorocentrum cordatum]
EETCPWSRAASDNVVRCRDLTSCRAEPLRQTCCDARGGILQCPENFPLLCGDGYCSDFEELCQGRGGVRECPGAEECPWLLPAPSSRTYACKDGSFARRSMFGHPCQGGGEGGILRCPLDTPVMCANKRCGGRWWTTVASRRAPIAPRRTWAAFANAVCTSLTCTTRAGFSIKSFDNLASRSTDPLAALSWISRLWRLRPETMLGAAVAAACSRDGRQEQEQEERISSQAERHDTSLQGMARRSGRRRDTLSKRSKPHTGAGRRFDRFHRC